MITILSIDGGGIRGLIPAAFIAEIEKRTGKPACRLFDLIAGTSTGGILAAMLTVPNAQGKPRYTAAQVQSLYTRFGRTVFQSSLWRKTWTLGGLANTHYSSEGLQALLDEYLGNARLHCALTDILITAYDMQSASPWFFKSRFAAGHRSDEDDPLLSQAVLATTAVPTYFPPCRIGEHCFIDGGVFAVNPTMCAYAEIKKLNRYENDILIVSLGTGEHNDSYTYKETRNWGMLRWAVPIIGVFTNSGPTVDYQMKQLAGTQQYFRLQIPLDSDSIAMDDAGDANLRRLEAAARDGVRRHGDTIDTICGILTAQ